METMSFLEENVSQLESFGEFDEPTPLGQTACTKVSLQQYQEQAACETESALVDLITYLDDNPEAFMKILRKRKQEELENGGLLSYLKVKFMETLHGMPSKKRQVSHDECQSKLVELKEGMIKAYTYAQESKGRRFSQRLASKRSRLTLVSDENTPPPGIKPPPPPPPVPVPCGCDNSMPPPPPPPPPCPDSPVIKLTPLKNKNVMMPYGCDNSMPPPPPPPPPCPDSPVIILTPPKAKNVVTSTPYRITPRRPLRDSNVFGSKTSLNSVHEELLATNPLKRLRSVRQPRTPGVGNLRRHATIGAGDTPSSLNRSESLSAVFLRIWDEKFRNVRSPSPCNVSHENTFSPLSPGGFTP